MTLGMSVETQTAPGISVEAQVQTVYRPHLARDDRRIAEAVSAAITTLPQESAFPVARRVSTWLNLDEEDRDRAHLASLAACMAERTLARRLLGSVRPALAMDPTGTLCLQSLLMEIATRAGRLIETDQELDNLVREGEESRGRLALPEPDILIDSDSD
jgi:hypothetical protein